MRFSSRALLVLSLTIMLGGIASSTVLFFVLRNLDRSSRYDEFSRFCRRKSVETLSQFHGGATIIQALQQKIVNSSSILSDTEWGNASSQLVDRGYWNVSALSNIHMFPDNGTAQLWAKPLNVSLRAPTVSSIYDSSNENVASAGLSNPTGALVVTSSYPPNQLNSKGVDYLRSNITSSLVASALSVRDLVVSVPLNNLVTQIRSVILFLPIFNSSTSAFIGAVSGVFRQDVIVVDKNEDPDIFYTVAVNGRQLLQDENQPDSFVTTYRFSVANAVVTFRCARAYSLSATPFVILALGIILSLFIPLASFQYHRQLRVISRENAARTAAEQKAVLARVGEAAANEAVQLKSAFLANLNHEVRTPLNGIQGNSLFLLETPLSSEQKTFVNTIHKSSDQLVSIFDDIIDYTQLDNGEYTPNSGPMRVDELLDTLQNMFATELAQQHDTLLVEYPRNCSEQQLCIICDASRLRRIVHKLVHNAIKFTQNGTVTVRATLPSCEPPYVSFEIIDTGIGISKEVKGLFSPFTQEDSKRSRRYGGAGMGLAISKRLADSLGGTISYESESGLGTRFILKIPYKQCSTQSSARPLCQNEVVLIDKQRQHNTPEESDEFHELEKLDRPPPLILIVDDNHVNLTVAEKTVVKLGYRTVLATNGQEAVNAVVQGGISAILMDISMPVMDGYEATHIIRESYKDIPIIAVTANALESERANCFAAGMQGFLTKPINRQKLETALNEVVGQ